MSEATNDKAMTRSEYQAHARARKDQRPAELVALKSGSKFYLRRPDIQGMMLLGLVPQTLVAEGLAAWKKSGIVSQDTVANQFGDKEIVDSLIFMREIVASTTVSPRLVEIATQDDEVAAEDMLPEDFSEIFSWALGVPSGFENLRNFRPGPERGIDSDSPDGANLQPEAEPSISN
jgi:hypothetical protein